MSSRRSIAKAATPGLSRREVLRAGAVAALTHALPRARREKLGRIGIQLYTVRQAFAADPAGTLTRLAEIGFQEVEFVEYPPGPLAAVRSLLERLGLRAPASHVRLAGVDGEWDRTLERAAELGQRYVVVASVAPAARRTLDDWKRVAASFNLAGEAARARGLDFCYHNHDFEFPLLAGNVPYDVLLGETDPRLVGFEMDLYWISKAGKDPLDYFARWPGRFPLVHVKDMTATPQRGFTEVGRGRIDFRRIFRRTSQAGIRHYFYEQDQAAGDPLESCRVSYDYLRSLTF